MKERDKMVQAWFAQLEDQIKRHKELYDQCVGQLYKGILADQISEFIRLREELGHVCNQLDIKVAS